MVLATVETHAHAAVAAVSDATTTAVIAGPVDPDFVRGARAIVEIHGVSMTWAWDTVVDPVAERGAVTALASWDGTVSATTETIGSGDASHEVDFYTVALPVGTGDAVCEVQVPPGRPLQRGADYQISGDTIHLVIGGVSDAAPVRVLTAGGAVQGYQEAVAVTIDLDLRVWGDDFADADVRAFRAVEAVAARFRDGDDVLATPSHLDGLSLRLRRPLFLPGGMRRAWHTLGGERLATTTFSGVVRGTCEWALRRVTASPLPREMIEVWNEMDIDESDRIKQMDAYLVAKKHEDQP